MGGRLSHFLEAWQNITDDSWTLQIIKEGFTIPLEVKPPLSKQPINLTADHPYLLQALNSLLEKGAVERVTNIHSPGFYSRLFLVPKKDGAWRPIIDLSKLNQFLTKESFKMETPSSIRTSVLPNHWGVSLDLTDAYFHIPIHPTSRKLLRFCVGNQVFQFKALPFGLSLAPLVFVKVMRKVAAFLRLNGVMLLIYFDDWLLLQANPHILINNLSFSWDTVSRLGLLLNPTKSSLVPSQDFIFVGMRFLTYQNLIQVPPTRVDSILNLSAVVLKRTKISARTFLSLLGTLNSAADLIQLGRLHLRPLQLYLLSRWRPHRDPISFSVPLTTLFKEALSWWSIRPHLLMGVPLSSPEPELFLVSDASQTGWGAHLEPSGAMVSGQWSNTELLLHINNLELLASFKAVQYFVTQLEHQSVRLVTDNSTVVAFIRRQGGTHSISLFRLVRSLLLFCRDHQIHLSVRHLPGRLNALADSLSRRGRLLPTEWSLNQETANLIFLTLGTPLVDLFATRFNHRLPLYVSPMIDPAAWAVDALSLSWDNLFGYAYPPMSLIPAILAKIKKSNARILLVAPLWPQRSWYNDILGLLYDHPRSLPLRKDLLWQRNGVLHLNPDMFHLHVWPLSGRASEREAFLEQLPLSLQKPGEHPLPLFTMQSGKYTRIGVVNNRWIRSIPLSHN